MPHEADLQGCGPEWEDEEWTPFADIGAELGVVARPAACRAGFDAEAPLVREAEELSVFPGVPLS